MLSWEKAYIAFTNPRAQLRQPSKIYPQLCLWKRPIYLSGSLTLRGRLQVYHMSRGYSSLVSSRNELIHSSGAPVFCNYPQRDTSKLSGLVVSRSHCGPTGLYIFAHFKSRCIRVWLPISLASNHWMLTNMPPFGTLQGLGTTLATRTYQEWIRLLRQL